LLDNDTFCRYDISHTVHTVQLASSTVVNSVICICVSLVYRNIIKFDLASRTMSLQAPALFASAYDVTYYTSSTGQMLMHIMIINPR